MFFKNLGYNYINEDERVNVKKDKVDILPITDNVIGVQYKYELIVSTNVREYQDIRKLRHK